MSGPTAREVWRAIDAWERAKHGKHKQHAASRLQAVGRRLGARTAPDVWRGTGRRRPPALAPGLRDGRTFGSREWAVYARLLPTRREAEAECGGYSYGGPGRVFRRDPVIRQQPCGDWLVMQESGLDI